MLTYMSFPKFWGSKNALLFHKCLRKSTKHVRFRNLRLILLQTGSENNGWISENHQ